MMSNNLNGHIRSDKAKWAITGIVLVLVIVMLVGMCLQLFGQGKVKPSEWFKKNKADIVQTNPGDIPVVNKNVGVPLVAGESYDKIYFTSDVTVWNEVGEFVKENDGIVSVAQSEKYLAIAYNLSFFLGDSAMTLDVDFSENDFFVAVQSFDDNYDFRVVYSSLPERLVMDHIVLESGLNLENGEFSSTFGKFLNVPYQEGSFVSKLLPEDIFNRLVSSVPFEITAK